MVEAVRKTVPDHDRHDWEVRYQKGSGAKYWYDERSGRTSWSAPDEAPVDRPSASQNVATGPPRGPRLQRRPSSSILTSASGGRPIVSPPPTLPVSLSGPPLELESERERLRRIGREKEAERELNKSTLNRPLMRTSSGKPAFPRNGTRPPQTLPGPLSATAARHGPPISVDEPAPVDRWPARPGVLAPTATRACHFPAPLHASGTIHWRLHLA